MIIYVLIVVIFAIIFFILSGNEDNAMVGFILFWIGLILIIMGFTVFHAKINRESYKKGQIDALTGKIHYKIEINSTKNWVEIKK